MDLSDIVTNEGTLFEEEVENQIDNEDYCIFVLDTETTGMQGIPLYHPKNQVLEICIKHTQSGQVFRRLCDPGESFFIPIASVQIHRIGRHDLRSFGVPLKDALQDMITWIKEMSNNKKVIIVAHNAPFDMTMIIKSMEQELQIYAGKNYELHEWLWFDTLKASRELFKELASRFFPVEKPYSLGTMMEFFFPEFNMSDAHSAKKDVDALEMLFVHKILPIVPSVYTPSKCPYMVLYKEETGPNSNLSLTLVSDLKGIGTWRAKSLNSICNLHFQMLGPEYKRFMCPVTLFTCAHLVAYGFSKYHTSSMATPHNNFLGWWGTCREIEYILRSPPLNIFSDCIISEVLSKCCSLQLLTFSMHTMREDGDPIFFPTMPGEPISYLPLILSYQDAQNLYKNLGYKSITDVLVDFKFTNIDQNAGRWLVSFNAQLSTQYTMISLKKAFDDVLKYGG